MNQKRYKVGARGEDNIRATLSEDNVKKIKIKLKQGLLKQKEIAKAFRISQSTVSDIKNGRIWNHV